MKRSLLVKIISSVMLLALLAVPGCSNKEEPRSETGGVSLDEVKQETKQAYNTTKEYAQEQVQTFRKETQTRLDQYENEIDQLQAKAKNLQGEAKIAADEQLAALREKREAVSEKVEDLSSSSTDAWEQVKSGIDAAMQDLGTAYQKAADEFGKLVE